ncbi:chromate transporter [Streptomyces yunnanensis]|uniref:Chromate transporter n=1 Tax=Streptomyces yunnanensis TaxID=156453 RepID=A0ABY8AIA0_9ACTN|nr:chromate transporter [Streptomyces yunnanensis]WEB44494.1 chromate transporter [Streptomyces yunnanensis]
MSSEAPSTPSSTGDTETPARATATATGDPGFAAVLRYFLRLGTLGFGGPIAVVGYMQRDLVETRGWIAEQDFLNDVALGQTMPGPLAAQVAMWVGYLRRGVLGAAATALAFIAPSFLMVTGVAAVYAHYAGLSAVQALFYGIAPAVMAIIAIAAYKLVRLTDDVRHRRHRRRGRRPVRRRGRPDPPGRHQHPHHRDSPGHPRPAVPLQGPRTVRSRHRRSPRPTSPLTG